MPTLELNRHIPILVFASDARASMFLEYTSTLAVAETSATIRLQHSVLPGTVLSVKNLENGREAYFVVERSVAQQQLQIGQRDADVQMWEAGIPESPELQARRLLKQSIEAELTAAPAEAPPPAESRPAAGAAAGAPDPRASLSAAAAPGTEAPVSAATGPEPAALVSAVRAIERDLKILHDLREAAGRKLLEAETLLQAAQKAVNTAREGLALSAEASAVLTSTLEAGQRLVSLAGNKPAVTQPASSAIVPAQAGRPARTEPPKPAAVAEQAPQVPRKKRSLVPLPTSDTRFLTGPLSARDNRFSRRVRVKTRARIRRPGSSEIVEPFDLSRSGVSFRSTLWYEVDSTVWVSMHYREDDPGLIETRTRIVRAVRCPGDGLYHYGATFEK